MKPTPEQVLALAWLIVDNVVNDNVKDGFCAALEAMDNACRAGDEIANKNLSIEELKSAVENSEPLAVKAAADVEKLKESVTALVRSASTLVPTSSAATLHESVEQQFRELAGKLNVLKMKLGESPITF